MSGHGALGHARHAVEGLKAATEHDGPKGALAGAVGVTATAAAGLALAGLALTPLGIAVVATAGATAGGTGLFKKLRDRFG